MWIGIVGLGRMGGTPVVRTASQGRGDCANEWLAMMRQRFGGHPIARPGE